MTPIKKWCGKNPSIDHIRTFVSITLAHISNDCRKKLDSKIHACIMMHYSEESKYYQLFDLVKQKIIIRRNVKFDENTSNIVLLKSPYGPFYSDLFGIFEDTKSIFSPMFTLTSSSTSILELTGSQSSLTETITSLDFFSSERNETSMTPYFPW